MNKKQATAYSIIALLELCGEQERNEQETDQLLSGFLKNLQKAYTNHPEGEIEKEAIEALEYFEIYKALQRAKDGPFYTAEEAKRITGLEF